MIGQKGNAAKPGGYVHAGIHVVGSVIVLAIVQVPWLAILELAIALAE